MLNRWPIYSKLQTWVCLMLSFDFSKCCQGFEGLLATSLNETSGNFFLSFSVEEGHLQTTCMLRDMKESPCTKEINRECIIRQPGCRPEAKQPLVFVSCDIMPLLIIPLHHVDGS